MNFGFNSNVRVGSVLYHVQTEDRGPAHPFLDSVVYEAGRVVHKRSSSYQDLLNATPPGDELPQRLNERIAQQHRDVISSLEAGTLALSAAPGLATLAALGSGSDRNAPAAGQGGLQIHLRNPRSWLAAGKVTLEVKVGRGEPSAGAAAVLAGTDVEVFLERGKDRSEPWRARADADGCATFSFALPSALSGKTSLVIRATDGDFYGELRFELKARPRTPVPAPSP